MPPSPAGATVGFCHARRPRTTDFASVRTGPRTWAVPTISSRAPLAASAERARSREQELMLLFRNPKGARRGRPEEGGLLLLSLLLLARQRPELRGMGVRRREQRRRRAVCGGPALLALEREEAATETTTGVPSAATPAAAAPPQIATSPRSPETFEGVRAKRGSAGPTALFFFFVAPSSSESSKRALRRRPPSAMQASALGGARCRGGRNAPSLSPMSPSLVVSSSLSEFSSLPASAASPQRNPSAAATAKGENGCAGMAVASFRRRRTLFGFEKRKKRELLEVEVEFFVRV